MSIDDRLRIAKKVKLCLKCHNPDYIYKKNDREHKCKRSKFTCKSCSYHMWICQRHKTENIEFLDQFSNDYRTKYNLDFGLFAMPSAVSGSPDPVVT